MFPTNKADNICQDCKSPDLQFWSYGHGGGGGPLLNRQSTR